VTVHISKKNALKQSLQNPDCLTASTETDEMTQFGERKDRILVAKRHSLLLLIGHSRRLCFRPCFAHLELIL